MDSELNFSKKKDLTLLARYEKGIDQKKYSILKLLSEKGVKLTDYEAHQIGQELQGEDLVFLSNKGVHQIFLTGKGIEYVEQNLLTENNPKLDDKNQDDVEKFKVFVSYSTADDDKVQIVANELEKAKVFDPLIIAQNREAMKLLADKVKEGILDAQIVIPILTSNSMNTQWINQEIGFATGVGTEVWPIVEKPIMKELKGFIHKEADLPYSYESNTDKKIENESFQEQLIKLVSDLKKKVVF